MGEREQLRAAILAAPDDDTLRGVFADYLDGLDVRRVSCPKCKGTGGLKRVVCTACESPVEGKPNWVQGSLRTSYACPHCGWRSDEGMKDKRDCPACEGTCTVPDTADRDRAELIRVQYELARGSGYEGYPQTVQRLSWEAGRGTELLTREWQLLAANPSWSKCPCPACGGDGLDAATSAECVVCGGAGDLFRQPVGHTERSRVLDWHAGWPRSLACTLAEAGAERGVTCRKCHGEGDVRFTCGGCDGSGTVRRFVPSAWAREVVKAVPVTRLVPGDREPQYQRDLRPDLPGDYWWWLRSANFARRDTLPAALHRLMTPDAGHADDQWSGFATPDAAVDALAVALCRLARKQGG